MTQVSRDTESSREEDPMPAPPSSNPGQFVQGAPVLHVPDVRATAAFYRDLLGFRCDFGDETYAVVWRDNSAIHFVRDDGGPHGVHLFQWVKDVDGYYREILERGAKVSAQPADQPYGIREFGLSDINGVRIVFGQDIERDPQSSNDSVIDWLLDADPSIRWQVMRDLTDTPADIVAAERSRVASEGWGARLLDEQRADGQWGDGVVTPFWWSNMYTLVFLRDLGIDPASARARAAIDRVRRNVTWGPEFGNSPFFAGEVEPCINGRVVALGAYFGERSDRLVDRLLSEQLADGGWNCEAERGSVRSSFHTTICVLEGLLAFEQAFGAAPGVTSARTRGEEYLLARRLLRRLSTGEIIQPAWSAFAFPPLWHYDVLRGLDYLRAAGVQPDARVEEAIAIVRERAQADRRWLLDVTHRDTLHVEMAGSVGAANRWTTLRALRVLDWYNRRD
jgi:catechol 2,3-dioxygenase-like lactoylglutathione lyase family enzyme